MKDMLKARVCCFINWIRINLFHSKLPRVILCEEFPEKIEDDSIYITYEENAFCYLLMKCPCGCGSNINLSFISGLKPQWTVGFNINGTISIMPSIWRKSACKSHFFINTEKLFGVKKRVRELLK